MFFGIIIFGTLVKIFPPEELSDVIVAYAIAGIILWVADLGSGYWMILQHSVGNRPQLKIEWSYRFIRGMFCSIMAGFIFAILKESFVYGLVIFACFWDLESDSGLGLRQVLFPVKTSITLQWFKKAFQLIPLLVMHFLDLTSLSLLSVILLFPVVFLKLIEVKKIGGLSLEREGARKGNTLLMWLQGGYSIILGFDVVLLDLFQLDSLIVSVALGKKLASSIFILGSTLQIETLGTIARSESNPNILINLRHEVRKVFVTSFIFSFVVLLLLNPILKTFNLENDNSLYFGILFAFVLSSPFSTISAYWNSILVGKGLMMQSAIQGYLCAFMYLSSMLIIGILIDFQSSVIFAICAKMFIELTVGRFFTRNVFSGIQ